MPRQRAIRFPDDLHDAIEAEARRLGHPHTFSSVIVNDMRRALGLQHGVQVLDHVPSQHRSDEALVRAVEAREAAAQVRAETKR